MVGSRKHFPMPIRPRRPINGNLRRHFQYLWHSKCKQKVKIDPSIKFLAAAHDILVQDPEECFTPAYKTAKAEDWIKVPAPVLKRSEQLHLIDSNYQPLLARGLSLAQNLCWSVVSHQFPDVVTANKRMILQDQQKLFQQGILSSHLLDSWMLQLPPDQNYELPNKLERVFNYGIPPSRKNALLSDRLLEIFCQTALDPMEMLTRPVLHHTSLNVSMRHSGSLVRLAMSTPLWMGSYTPLAPVSSAEDTKVFIAKPVDDVTRRKILRKQIAPETGGVLQTPMPDIHPLLPFIGAQKLDSYDLVPDTYVTNSPVVHPHTVFIHHVAPLLPLRPLDGEQKTAQTLLNLHAHALCYALSTKAKFHRNGLLQVPVVVQGVHFDQNRVQNAVYQLNTIGPYCQLTDDHSSHISAEEQEAAANIRNVLFVDEFEDLYTKCERDESGKPLLVGLNTEKLSTMRALCERN